MSPNIRPVSMCIPIPYAMFVLPLLQSGDLYGAVCDGCSPECTGCIFDPPSMAPVCEDVMHHATSPGGTDTLDMISIEPGYWRATPFSTEVLPCYHAEACLGGVTGTLEYCLKGNEGPCE